MQVVINSSINPLDFSRSRDQLVPGSSLHKRREPGNEVVPTKTIHDNYFSYIVFYHLMCQLNSIIFACVPRIIRMTLHLFSKLRDLPENNLSSNVNKRYF